MVTSHSLALVVVTAVVSVMTPNLLSTRPTPQFFGSCDEEFKEVEHMFRSNIETGRDYGGAFSVYHKGELVCDLYGGWADMEAEKTWKEDTISILFSATKGIASLCIAVLRDRGLLDYDSAVSEFWPEFSQEGKENITIRTLLSHQAGLAAITTGEITYSMIRDDPETIGKLLAAQAPNWTPGEQFGYHALSFGLFIDQIIRRVDPHHRSLDQFFQEEIAVPFDLDLSIGLPLESYHRVARIEKKFILQTIYQGVSNLNIFSQIWRLMSTWDSIKIKAFTNPGDIGTVGGVRYNWPEYQQIPFGSTSGYGTARALARLYGILANGGKLPSGQVLLSPATIAIADTPVSPGPIVDAILGAKRHWGYGFQHFAEPGVRNGYTSFGHTGFGGQIGFANTAYKAGWAYITNHPSFYLDPHQDIRIMLLEKVLFETLRNS